MRNRASVGILHDKGQIDLEEWIAEDVRRRASIDPNAGARSRRTSLTRVETQELTSSIAKRVETFGSAYKPTRSRDDPEGGGRIFPPDVRNSGFYPISGIAKAASWAKRAAQVGTTGNLRFLTLRAKRPPDPGELDTHLRTTSKLLGEHGTYLQKRGIAQVLLNVVNVRLDEAVGRFDPHVHCIWEIQPENLAVVSEYLRKRYEVWIDDEPIRDIKKAVFYICSGIFDYPAMPTWPLDLFKEAHALNGLKLIRASGPLKRAKAEASRLLCKHCAGSKTVKRMPRHLAVKEGQEALILPTGQPPIGRTTDSHRCCCCCGTTLGTRVHSGDEKTEVAPQLLCSEVPPEGGGLKVISTTSSPDERKTVADPFALHNAGTPAQGRHKRETGPIRREAQKDRVRRTECVKGRRPTMSNSYRVTVRPTSQDSAPHEPRLSALAQVAALLHLRTAHPNDDVQTIFDRLRIDELQATRTVRDVEIFFGVPLVDVDDGWTLTPDGSRFLKTSRDAIRTMVASMRAFEGALPSSPRSAVWDVPEYG